MSFNIFKHPEVRIDIMVEKQFWPAVVNIIGDRDGTYFKEDNSQVKDREYVLIRDVKTVHAYELALLIEDISRFEQNKAMSDGVDPKIYILIKPRKKGKNHVQKDREETGARSESGDGRESGTDQPGQDAGSGESGSEPVDAGDSGAVQLEMDIPEVVYEGGDYDGDN